jgi:hypothetical protein
VSVQGSEGVGNHKMVVPRVEVPVEEPVGVQGSVPCVLPQVEPDHPLRFGWLTWDRRPSY